MHRRTFLSTAASALIVLPAPALIAGGHGRLGTFTGPARYGAAGTAEIAGDTISLLDDFRFGKAPDPKIALGRNGYDPKTLMGALKKTSGASSYKAPKGIDTDQYNEVWIWCQRFNVQLGVARIG